MWRGWEGLRRRGGGRGWDCGASPEREGKETEEWPGKWSAVSTALPPLAAATVPAASHECCMGHYRESVPSPLPPWWGGGREGKSPAWGGWRRGGEMMAPTRHQETGPAAASSHAALSHSSGCDRDGGSRERERGRPLKRQQRRHRGLLGTGAREGEALLLGRKVAQGFLAN